VQENVEVSSDGDADELIRHYAGLWFHSRVAKTLIAGREISRYSKVDVACLPGPEQLIDGLGVTEPLDARGWHPRDVAGQRRRSPVLDEGDSLQVSQEGWLLCNEHRRKLPCQVSGHRFGT
jgi:hypothetical protein